MPREFTPQPNAPLTRDGGYASQALAGYFNQFDLVEQRRLVGRWEGAGVGPFQWVTLGSGLDFSADGELSATGLGGDVVGPAAATDGALAVWDGATGHLLADSSVLAAWFDQAVLTTSTPTFAGAVLGALTVNGFVVTVSGAVTLNNWFDQAVKAASSPTFNGLTLTSLSVNTHTVTVSGATTLNDWFDQSVKAAASPTFAGLTVNSFALTVNGAPTLNDWFDQSVKTTASPTFNQVNATTVVSTGNIRTNSAFNQNGTSGDSWSGLQVALTAGGTFFNFDVAGGIIVNSSVTL